VSSSWIRPRATSRGRSHQVLYRRGGRGFPIETGGTFTIEREARLRRDVIGGWIAAGLDPREQLEALAVKKAPPAKRRRKTLADWWPEYAASRVDVAESYRQKLPSIGRQVLTPRIAGLEPAEITVQDVQAWMADLGPLQPATVKKHVGVLRLLLDFAGADPNPARDKRVRLPRVTRKRIVPPSGRQVLSMLDAIAPKWRLPLVLIEQTGMAIGETLALQWGDVDVAGDRLQLRHEAVKGGYASRAREVQVPGWLMEILDATVPLEDRTAGRLVFPGLSTSAAGNAIERACVAAGVPHFHPHDLRHRRISLWHGQGIPARQLAERAGHAKASMSLDVYSHVMQVDEIESLSLEALLARAA
jgi:integrase